jgi:MSHA pilin protein MshB
MKQVKNLKQANGFTIIELVVVILLLGILTATALPRFMDVADEAHDAVVDGVLGGLATGSALFRAQWMATGQPAIVVDFGNMNANATGFPIGLSGTATTLDVNADCVDIFNALLQPAGRPNIVASTVGVGAALTAAQVTGVAANVDFVAHQGPAGVCEYVYTGQFKSAVPATAGVPVINFNVTTQTIALGTEL